MAQVFLGHICTYFTAPRPLVEAVYFIRGVPILFILCGFLTARSLEERPPKEFLLRRAARILPGFWVCVAVNSVIILLVYDTVPTLKEGIVYCLTQFTGLNFYTGGWLRGYGVGAPNGVLWTIPVQIQFFLLAPLIHRAFAKKPLRSWIGSVLGLTALSVLCARTAAFLPEVMYKLLNVTVLPYLYFLVFGMMSWYCRNTVIPFLRAHGGKIILLYIAWKTAEIFLEFPHIADGYLYNTVTTLLMGCVIFAFAFKREWRMRRDLTYGFYLYQMVVVNLAIELGFDTMRPAKTGIMLFTTVVIVTLALAAVSDRFIERPAAKALERRMG